MLMSHNLLLHAEGLFDTVRAFFMRYLMDRKSWNQVSQKPVAWEIATLGSKILAPLRAVRFRAPRPIASDCKNSRKVPPRRVAYSLLDQAERLFAEFIVSSYFSRQRAGIRSGRSRYVLVTNLMQVGRGAMPSHGKKLPVSWSPGEAVSTSPDMEPAEFANLRAAFLVAIAGFQVGGLPLSTR